MRIGYARVSTADQNLELQISALQKVGCDKIVEEKMSATKVRPKLEQILDQLRQGDCLVVWRLDRLGRSLRELVFIIEDLEKRGVDFLSVTERFDTTGLAGRLLFYMAGVWAEMERRLNVERTKAGIDNARQKGVILGRRRGLSAEAEKLAAAVASLYVSGDLTTTEIRQVFNMSSATLYRYLKYKGITLKKNPGRRKRE